MVKIIKIFTNKDWIGQRQPGFKFIEILEGYKLSSINYQFIVKVLKQDKMAVEYYNGTIKEI